MNENEIEYYKNKITETLINIKPLKIILFGSAAQNKMNADSDFDFLIVLNEPELPKSYDEKLELKLMVRNSLGDLSQKVPIDLIVYTIPEYEELKKLNTSFFKEINNTGQVLYEKAS